MASQRQIEANRRNAAGPHKMSEEGKEAIRQNAIRHGLAAKRHIVLRGEDESFYNEIVNALYKAGLVDENALESVINQMTSIGEYETD